MADSEKSFVTLYGRFQNGDVYVQGLPEFLPQNPLIQKANLTTFIGDVAVKDEAVTLSLEDLKNEVSTRKNNSFRIKGCNENCLENRMRNIHAYIGADIGKKCAAYKIIGAMLKKIAPIYKKKDPLLPRGAGKSPSEKSFVALNGYAKQTFDLITELGVAYAPQNVNIQAVAFGAFVAEMVDMAKSIASFLGIYSNTVSARSEMYYNNEGLLERERLIKDYLASFSGGKKSQDWIEYDRLIKGLV